MGECSSSSGGPHTQTTRELTRLLAIQEQASRGSTYQEHSGYDCLTPIASTSSQPFAFPYLAVNFLLPSPTVRTSPSSSPTSPHLSLPRLSYDPPSDSSDSSPPSTPCSFNSPSQMEARRRRKSAFDDLNQSSTGEIFIERMRAWERARSEQQGAEMDVDDLVERPVGLGMSWGASADLHGAQDGSYGIFGGEEEEEEDLEVNLVLSEGGGGGTGRGLLDELSLRLGGGVLEEYTQPHCNP